jgi:hypothetical protein
MVQRHHPAAATGTTDVSGEHAPGRADTSGRDAHAGGDAAAAAVALARTIYLDERHPYGCAETSYMVLLTAFGLDPGDAGAAMALNGGIAYSGGPCGALTGAAIAVGRLAERRIGDHARAKRVAREIVAEAMACFRVEHGAVDCRDLIGVDLQAPGGHDAFLASGSWRDGCMRQIESVVRRLAPLTDQGIWDDTDGEIEARSPD